MGTGGYHFTRDIQHVWLNGLTSRDRGIHVQCPLTLRCLSHVFGDSWVYSTAVNHQGALHNFAVKNTRYKIRPLSDARKRNQKHGLVFRVDFVWFWWALCWISALTLLCLISSRLFHINRHQHNFSWMNASDKLQ